MTSAKLQVELVPRTCWYSNVRTNVSASDWNLCKGFVRFRSGDRCEICGGVGKRWPVECHEVWSYEITPMPSIGSAVCIQRLEGLIALCPACHEVKHIGRAEAIGRLAPAMRHMMAVNNWSEQETRMHLHAAFDLWELRSRHDWKLDISYLVEVLGP